MSMFLAWLCALTLPSSEGPQETPRLGKTAFYGPIRHLLPDLVKLLAYVACSSPAAPSLLPTLMNKAIAYNGGCGGCGGGGVKLAKCRGHFHKRTSVTFPCLWCQPRWWQQSVTTRPSWSSPGKGFKTPHLPSASKVRHTRDSEFLC